MSTTTIDIKEFPVFIGGEWVHTDAPRTARLPYDGTRVGTAANADAAIVERAIVAARRAAEEMARLTQYERAELTERMRRLLERDAEQFAHLVCCETGKPIPRRAWKWSGEGLTGRVFSRSPIDFTLPGALSIL